MVHIPCDVKIPLGQADAQEAGEEENRGMEWLLEKARTRPY